MQAIKLTRISRSRNMYHSTY